MLLLDVPNALGIALLKTLSMAIFINVRANIKQLLLPAMHARVC